MKRVLSILLAVLLALTALPALAAPGEVMIFPQNRELNQGSWGYQCSLAVVGDTLYVHKQYERLDRWRPGEAVSTQLMDLNKYFMDGTETAEPTELTEDIVYDQEYYIQREARTLRKLVGGGDVLYAIDYANQALWKFNEQRSVFEKAVELQQDGLTFSWDATSTSPTEITSAWIIEGSLFMVLRDYSNDTRALRQFDLSTGKSVEIKVDRIYEVMPYQPGKLLVTLGDWSMESIGVLDLTTGKVEEKLKMEDLYNAAGLQYDPATDSIYLVMPGAIMRSVSFGAFERVAYLPISDNYDIVTALLPGGMLAATQEAGISIRNLDPQYLPARALRLSESANWDDAVRSYSNAHPEVPIEFTSGYASSAEEIALMLAAGSAPDVFTLDASYVDMAALAKKGYLYDLSGDAAIAAEVAKYYPDIQEALTVNGQLIGIPTSYYSSGWGYSLKGFEAVGLTEADVPTTYSEILELFDRWELELAGQYPSMELFEGGDVSRLKQDIMNMILIAQMLHCSVTDQPMTVDTPSIRQLFQQMERTRFGSITEEQEMNGFSWSDDGETPIALFSKHISPVIEQYGGWGSLDMKPLMLSIDEQTPAYLNAYMTVFCVNPNSDNLDAAVEFVRYLATDMQPWMRINMCPDYNEPVESSYYQEQLRRYESSVKSLEEKLEKADEGDKTSLKTDIERYKESWSWLEKERWDISVEEIEAYRAVHDKLKFNKSITTLTLLGDDLMTLFQRFNDGQMKSDQFLTELSQKLRMAQMEG